MKIKHPLESVANMTQLIQPNDTNIFGNLMGGRLLYWIDIVAAIAACKHSNRVCVTAAFDFVDFKSAVHLGEIVMLEAKVTRAFTSSMEVKVVVYAEDLLKNERRMCHTAYCTFVAIDQVGSPIPVNKLEPQTVEEKEEFDTALLRREYRLQQAGRTDPKPAGN